METYLRQKEKIDRLLSDSQGAEEVLLDIPRKELLQETMRYLHLNRYVTRSVANDTKTVIAKW